MTRALLAGHALVTGGVLAVLGLVLALGATLFPTVPLVVFAGVGATLGWPWWSAMVPRWWRWALGKGLDPYALQAAGEAAQLLWPRDSIFERTEFGNRWEGIDSFAPNPLLDLRDQLLSGSTPSEFGVSDDREVWGVVSEFGLPGGSASLITLDDGTCSLYTSTGGGVIGAGEHEGVRRAVERLVEVGRRVVPEMNPTRDLSLPPEGQVSFFALLPERVVGLRDSEENLREGNTPGAQLYAAAQEVIAQLREGGL